MVADTNKAKTADVFETMTQQARNAMDTSRRMQDCWFSAVTNFSQGSNGHQDAVSAQARFAESWFSQVCDNMQRFGEATISCCQTNMDAAKVACDVAMNTGEGDAYTSQRKVMDSTFQAMQKNADVMNKAGKSAIDGWAAVSKSGMCCGAGTSKAHAKDTK